MVQVDSCKPLWDDCPIGPVADGMNGVSPAPDPSARRWA